MPIRPENVARYPANWHSEIRPRILKRAENAQGWPCCEECGVPNYAVGYRDEYDAWRPMMESDIGEYRARGYVFRVIKIILTIAHLNDKIEDCGDENLRAWCQRCHNRYDMPARRAGIAKRAREAKAVGDLFTC